MIEIVGEHMKSRWYIEIGNVIDCEDEVDKEMPFTYTQQDNQGN
jgi:hypothetical protein